MSQADLTPESSDHSQQPQNSDVTTPAEPISGLKIAIAQQQFVVGDVISNAKKMVQLAEDARDKGANLIVFSELSLLGYPPEDLLLRPSLASRIKMAFEIFEEKNAQSVVSVCEAEHSPLLCNTLKEDQSMCGFVDLQKVGRRQDMGTYYRLNGAIYLQTTT